MLLGRLLECARLERLIAATAAGSGDVLLLRGVPGSGKSALLEFAVARAERLMVLRAAGVPGETELAFGGILELLQPIAGDLPKLPAPQRDALSGALGVAPAVERDRFLIGAATLRLLLHAGQRQPVLVAVDDAH